MMRPGIVRADTIDLQDPDSPSAAGHTRQTPSNGLAPHQAAEVHHVMEERNSEEQAMADAWNVADNLGNHADNEVNHLHGNEIHGNEHHVEDGAEGGETESDGEDDMMDRISSSPSIDDGGYAQYSSPSTTPRTAWPDRTSSLSPWTTPTPPRESFNKSASSSPASSLSLHTPEHLPFSVASLVRDDWLHSACQTDESPSPCVVASRARDISLATFRQLNSPLSSMHHHMGRYGGERGYAVDSITKLDDHSSNLLQSANESTRKYQDRVLIDELENRDYEQESITQQADPPSEAPMRRFPNWTDRPNLQCPNLSSIPSVDLLSLLLPVNDPLLNPPPSPTGSADSWESNLTLDFDVAPREVKAQCGYDDVEYYDDDAHDTLIDLDDRFIDSGWGGECLREVEDIDFELVYALHNFVATVEGQANATKGDTMVLLDDSNSYWWLVRVVKDSSIGYLPAEHIETPTERLARLNKHRNIDLSATMLSDNSEKPMNPLKKAMRRRNAKTVQFAAPTYVEASDNDYSSDEEDQVLDPYAVVLDHDETQQSVEPAAQVQVEPEDVKEPHTEKRSSTSSNRASFDREQAATAAQALAEAGITSDDDPQIAPKLVDKTEAAPLKSRKGSRNTDSFLKDDSLETRKITLTPGLLREENGSLDSPIEQSRNNSLDSLTKVTSSESLKKDGKDKKKESKKGGILSGLFKSKKKDKKAKDSNGETESEKASMDLGRESPKESLLTSGRSSPVEKIATPQQTFQDPTAPQTQYANPQPPILMDVAHNAPADSGFIAELPGSEVAYEMATGHEDAIAESHLQVAQPEKARDGPLSPLTSILHKDPKPPKAKRAKRRVQLDDFDSPPEMATNPFDDQQDYDDDRLSDSPVEVSNPTFMHGTESIHIPVVDPEATEDEEDRANEKEEDDEDPVSLTSSPSLIDHPSEPMEKSAIPSEDSDPTPTASRSPQPLTDRTASVTPVAQPTVLDTSAAMQTRSAPSATSPASSPQAWNDGHLRSWLDESSEVRDMLVIIRDQTGVTPVSAGHPLMSGLYSEPRKGVQDMMGQLDGLLGSYLQRKGVQF